MFDWIGLRHAPVHLVMAPLFVAELRVVRQAEMLAQVAPAPGYLDLIAPWAKAVEPVPSPLLYVARTALPQVGGGAHAGESHLVQVLQGLGVAVLDPARASIVQQMAAYAGAARLVFAEGSALHGRQLLGYLPQQIEVLRRRPGKVTAKAALTPRCNGLTYHDIDAGQLMAYWKSSAPRPDPALSLYDLPRLFAVFQGFGVDLAAGWDSAEYHRAAQADVQAWTEARPPPAKAPGRTPRRAGPGWALGRRGGHAPTEDNAIL